MHEQKPIAIVGMGAIMPEASDAHSFWKNILAKTNTIGEVPPDRWPTTLYYSPDPKAPDKSYSKIGAWVKDFHFEPSKMRIPIPPTVIAQMDQTQQWGIVASYQALSDYGYPQKGLDPERVAVILGNSNAGERHYRSTMRILLPEYLVALSDSDAFRGLPEQIQQQILAGFSNNIQSQIPEITEDTMSGELSNIIAGRIANVFNFSGPNFVTDAACASSLSALQAAVQGLNAYQFDAVLTGGVDRNMGPESYVKFCKIGALSAQGSRPYADGADGFVMGEGTAIYLLKRLEDAERDEDRIYAVIRGIGSSSDGKGKGITAPNPLGQQRAIERAWKNAGVSPASIGLIEGHGTSTRVGDVVEVNSMNAIFGQYGLPVGSIALGSVKSNIGHLKSAAGAAAVLKTAYALYEKLLPPSINFHQPNPNIDFAHMPMRVNTETRPWEKPVGEIRRAGVSSFGFGGTNFHVVLEEYVPGMHQERAPLYSMNTGSSASPQPVNPPIAAVMTNPSDGKSSLFNADVNAFVLTAVSEKTGYPPEMLDQDLDLEADLGIDTVKQAELFATIREHYGIPRREDLRLSDYNTLAKVVGFVMNAAGSIPPAVEIQTVTEIVQPVSDKPIADVKAFVLEKVAEKTGYPVEMLDLDLDLEADLGIDTVKQAELFATIREHYNIPRREDLRLSDYNTLTKVVGFMQDALQAIPSAPAVPAPVTETSTVPDVPQLVQGKTHFRGLYFLGAQSNTELKAKLQASLVEARAGKMPPSRLPEPKELSNPERLAIDYSDTAEFIKRAEKTLSVFESNQPGMWQALTAQGVYRGSGTPGKVAFLFPGQGSQYVNMLRELREIEPVVDQTFIEADRVMTALLGKPLTAFIYADGDETSLKAAEAELKNTKITQPAVLTANVALLRLLQQYGFHPDMVIGHSLGEYAALVAAGVLTFAEALEVVSARGREMSNISLEDNGCMAAVSAPLAEVERIMSTIDGYVVLANINSPLQSVIAGSTVAVDAAISAFQAADFQAVKIPVSHAFHTKIVAPASEPLRKVIDGMNIQSPRLPIAANVTGDWYPTEREAILDILADQVASPVQFIKGMQKLYNNGARIFIEVGPKRVLNALATDIFKENNDVQLLASNHPRKGALPSFNEALCGLFAAGLPLPQNLSAPQITTGVVDATPNHAPLPVVSNEGRQPLTGSVVISGAGLGLPGRNNSVFAGDNVQRLLNGEVRIEPFPDTIREQMLARRVTRLVKSDAGAQMVEIDDFAETVKLAGQRGTFDPVEEFGIPADRVEATDISTQLAIAAGIDALHDAGIPLVMTYRHTSKNTLLPNRWMLPEAMQDETGVIFASAFPGLDRMADEAERYYTFQSLSSQRDQLQELLTMVNGSDSNMKQTLQARITDLDQQMQEHNYQFDRRFIFRVLAMGHSQFAEHIGARGPNTSVNAACATTTHAVGVAEDWIRSGRCRRVIVIAGDDVSSGSLVNWIGTGLMASGAATIEGELRLASLPFDRRRNGMIMGMGAAALVIESEDAVRERGMRGICELLSSQFANSAFHGTRLDVPHVGAIMERLVSVAEQRFGIQRAEMAARTVFVSHETYTPARGGSAAAEIHALRHVFGENANQVIIANTKGFTGHTMGVGVEDVLAAKALEYGQVPPIAHYDAQFEADPDLGDLNLSQGGKYPVEFALRLGAGFGSQIAMTLTRKVAGVGERVNPQRYQQWLAEVSGYPQAELETVQHNLRIRHTGAPTVQPAASHWNYGQGPTLWASQAPSPQEIQVVTQPLVTVPLPEQVQEIAAVVQETPAAAVVSIDDQEIAAVVLAKVSEKTGYPAEMLDPDLDLEADLGIDTVKQAELFASIREHYGIPRREDLRLSEYNTLTKVIGFVRDAQAELNAIKEIPVEEPVAEPSEIISGTVQRHVPQAVLRPRLELCKPSGITLNADSRVVILSGTGKTAAALQKQLRTQQVEAVLIKAEGSAAVAEQISKEHAKAPISGLYYLPTLDEERPLSEMDTAIWQNALETRFHNLVAALRVLPDLKFLVVATRFDGLHGLSDAGAVGMIPGAAAGFAKAIARERKDIFVKVVDVTRKEKPAVIADHLVAETLNDPAIMEVAWEDSQRFTLVLSEEALPAQPTLELAQDSVFLVSGGTGGITAPIITDLAKTTHGHFYLLGRSTLPAKDDPNLKLVSGDTEELKRSLMQQMSADGSKVTPAMINNRIAALTRAAATLETIKAVEKIGGKAEYIACDVNDPQAVAKAVDQVLSAEPRVNVLIHAAGVERSRKLESKSEEEFRQVFDAKVNGFYHLFKALENRGQIPQAIVNFSSVAGRFGNAGQTDYSAANDLLARLASAFRGQYPNIQVITIDWGAWAEVGMASRGHIPELMRRAGIEMMNPEEAAACVARELQAGTRGEVILAGALGALEDQTDPHGGLDIEKANTALTQGNPIHVMLSRASGISLSEGILLEAELDPTHEAFLIDHALNGVPLLPGVMGIEGFAVAAEHVATSLGASKSGFRVEKLADINFLTPFKFYRDEARLITWKAQVVREAEGLVAHVLLESKLARLQGKVDVMQHFSGKVHLVPANQPHSENEGKPPHWNGSYTVQAEDIYKLYFHGPSFQVLDSVQRNGETMLGKLNKDIPPITENEDALLSLPILVELCLQTAGVWEIGTNGSLSLPQAIGALRLYENKVNGVPIYAEVTPKHNILGELSFDARVIDGKGHIYLEMEDYRTAQLPYGIEEKELLAPIEALLKDNQ